MPARSTNPPKQRRYAADKRAAADLANALMDLPDSWVICRDMRHAWDVLEDFHVTAHSSRRIQEIGRTLACVRCMTLRKETYVHDGYGLDKIGQHYVYPEHYQIKGVPRGVKPQAIVQAEQYRRAMERIANTARTGS